MFRQDLRDYTGILLRKTRLHQIVSRNCVTALVCRGALVVVERRARDGFRRLAAHPAVLDVHKAKTKSSAVVDCAMETSTTQGYSHARPAGILSDVARSVRSASNRVGPWVALPRRQPPMPHSARDRRKLRVRRCLRRAPM